MGLTLNNSINYIYLQRLGKLKNDFLLYPLKPKQTIFEPTFIGLFSWFDQRNNFLNFFRVPMEQPVYSVSLH